MLSKTTFMRILEGVGSDNNVSNWLMEEESGKDSAVTSDNNNVEELPCTPMTDASPTTDPCHVEAPGAGGNAGLPSLFDAVPTEVLRSILGYMDVPSLAALSVTHKAKHANLSSLASDDVTWLAIVQRRFGLALKSRTIARPHRRSSPHRPSKKCRGDCARAVVARRGRPTPSPRPGNGNGRSDPLPRRRCPATYGGPTWKDAYRALASVPRVPATSLTSGAAAVFASPRPRDGSPRGPAAAADALGCWCMLHHAENCRTKTVEGTLRRLAQLQRQRRGEANFNFPYPSDRRYVEMRLCLQNVKSGCGDVVVPDVPSIRVASCNEDAYRQAWGWDRWDDGYDPTFRIVADGPWAPRMLLLRRFGADADDDRGEGDGESHQRDSRDVDAWDGGEVALRPFELAVLSVHVSVPSGLVFETDVLSSMSSVRVPVFAEGRQRARSRWNRNACDVAGNGGVSVSHFISEDALWKHYSQLPGGCLSLTDNRTRLA